MAKSSKKTFKTYQAAKLPHNVYICSYHKNMQFALDSLVKVDRLLFANVNSGNDSLKILFVRTH